MTKQLAIVDSDGNVAAYQGKRLVFSADERQRAEMILWLVQRQAVHGDEYRLVERE